MGSPHSLWAGNTADIKGRRCRAPQRATCEGRANAEHKPEQYLRPASERPASESPLRFRETHSG
jgi:hypothetical protein